MSTVDPGPLSEAPRLRKGESKEKVESVISLLSSEEGPKRAQAEENSDEHNSSSGRLARPTEPFGSAVAAREDKHAGEEDLETGVVSQQRSRFRELPEHLAALFVDREFQDDNGLQAALEELNISDEPIVLGDDGKPCYYMPGDNHNSATAQIVKNFYDWANKVKGVAAENTNIRLGPRLPGAPPPRKKRKPKTRLPDVALWGRSKCVLRSDGRVSHPMSASTTSTQPKVHPHVVIQVSVFNDEDYEIDAINDLSTRAIDGQGSKPDLSVLIKEREADPAQCVQAGFDIYYLPKGTYLEDALNGTNQARHVIYYHGGPDVLVTISEADLGGINLSLWQSLKDYFQGGSRDFQISMKELYGAVF